MDYRDQLINLGLDNLEAKAYLGLLEMDSGTILGLTHKTGIKRSNMYNIMDSLVQKKLVILTNKNGKRRYYAEDPKKIRSLLSEEEKNLSARKQKLLEIIPELSSIYSANVKKPKIRFYEGREEIKQVFEEILMIPKGSEVIGYTSSEEIAEGWISDFAIYYRKQRIANGIVDRTIAEDAPFTRELQKHDKEALCNMVLIDPKKFPLNNQINIFGNKVLLCSFKDELSLIIESKAIADNQRSIFEIAWAGAQQLGAPSPNPYIPPKK